jgi:hypothetical protein
MMQKLANIPWSLVLLIAIGWSAAWLLAYRVFIWHELRSIRAAEQMSGGMVVSAVGFAMTTRGLLTTFGPPIVLLFLRAIAPRTAH